MKSLSLVSCLALILAGLGCQTRRIVFRRVDETTRVPLADVQGRVWITQDDILLGSGSELIDLGRSGSDGIIHVGALKKWNQHFRFYKDGYAMAQAEHTRTDWRRVWITAGANKNQEFDESEVVEISMRKKVWLDPSKVP
jgi:hypothetical protein